jgi:hypothetical protein
MLPLHIARTSSIPLRSEPHIAKWRLMSDKCLVLYSVQSDVGGDFNRSFTEYDEARQYLEYCRDNVESELTPKFFLYGNFNPDIFNSMLIDLIFGNYKKNVKIKEPMIVFYTQSMKCQIVSNEELTTENWRTRPFIILGRFEAIKRSFKGNIN